MSIPDLFLVAFSLGVVAGWAAHAVTPPRQGPGCWSFTEAAASPLAGSCPRAQFQPGQGGDTRHVRRWRAPYDWSKEAVGC